MNRLFGLLCLALACFLLELLWRRKSWEHGYEHGYRKGRQDAENWIVNLEADVDLERQKIWREEENPYS